MFQSDRGDKFGGGRGGKKFGGNKFGKRSFGGDRGFRDGGRPMMHKAVCDECGKPCEVPFKPSGDRPVYCNNCFKKNDGGDSRRPERDSGKKSYGGNSYGGGGNNYGGGNKNDMSQEQFAILNAKLDEILEALTSIAEDEDEDENEES